MTNQEQTTWIDASVTSSSTEQAATAEKAIPAAKDSLFSAVLPDTPETKRLKENYSAISAAIFAYSVFYPLCMYRNGSGITFPFFLGSGLLLLGFLCGRLGMTLKKGSGFYMAAILLLGISTCCTDDARIILFNKLGVFLLMMSLLLRQYYDTSKWQMGKYLGAICALTFGSLGEWGRPVSDRIHCKKNEKRKIDKRIWYVLLGVLCGLPLMAIVLLLLASADAVFRQITDRMLESIHFSNSTALGILFRIALLFFATYALFAYLCKKKIKEEVADRRTGEPILAITVTGLLTALYLLFSGIQILGLFLGKLQLPPGYTYAMYAREGFFQLLAVGFLNLVIVLVCMSFFRDSKVLKAILTAMSLCTFIMIASSAMRMILYIRYYYLTFLRILVLWGLALLALLFVGVVIRIFRERFPLFRYAVATVTVLYLALSFAHPDLIIAKVNVQSTRQETAGQWGNFFLAKEPYDDYGYLRSLCADAAPILVPYLEDMGYSLEAFYEDFPSGYAFSDGATPYTAACCQEGFGYYWMEALKYRTGYFNLRTFNLSRAIALQEIRQATGR